MGIFLVDIYDQPIKVRGSAEAEKRIIDAIPTLEERLRLRGIEIQTQQTIFLLARNSYEKHIRKQYPFALRVPWIKFRMANIENET